MKSKYYVDCTNISVCERVCGFQEGIKGNQTESLTAL